MKKSILIPSLVVIALGLTAFSYVNWNGTDPEPIVVSAQPQSDSTAKPANCSIRYKLGPWSEVDMFYDVGTRFKATISKENLHAATSIVDIVPKEATEHLENYHFVTVSVLEGSREIVERGSSDALTEEQLKLMRSTDYAANIHIGAGCEQRNTTTGELSYYDLVYYMTVIPERQAVYAGGKEALLAHFEIGAREKTSMVEEKRLEPGMIEFTVTKNGTIANVSLSSKCGYDQVDETMMELMRTMPGKWNPALNSKGQPVNQELVFFFGRVGC